MAFYSGTANDIAALRSALISAMTSNGWSWNSSTNVMSKGSAFFALELQAYTSPSLTILTVAGMSNATTRDPGRTGSRGSGQAAGIGHPIKNANQASNTPDITTSVAYPVNYFIHIQGDEVALVMRYSTSTLSELYQWVLFGRSLTPTPGTGTKNFVYGASSVQSGTVSLSNFTYTAPLMSSVINSNTFLPQITPPGLTETDAPYRLHSGFTQDDATGWKVAVATTGHFIWAPLYNSPNIFNGQAILVPLILCAMGTGRSAGSALADSKLFRFVRLDNFSAGQVVQVGADYWKVYPFFRRVDQPRSAFTGVSGIDSGELGIALKYDGPV